MINSQYDASSGIMVHLGSKNVPVKEILAATRHWFTHSEFDPVAPVIWNLDDAYLDMSLEEMRQMYPLVRAAVDSKRSGGKTGWVHSSGMVLAMINVVGDEFEWGSEWGTFHSFDEAVAWCLV